MVNKQPSSYDCFICGVRNDAGLHADFFERMTDDGVREVEAIFTGRNEHQGYPGRMHGGVITAILDETIGRAINIGETDMEKPANLGCHGGDYCAVSQTCAAK